jgi:hypothetical protein
MSLQVVNYSKSRNILRGHTWTEFWRDFTKLIKMKFVWTPNALIYLKKKIHEQIYFVYFFCIMCIKWMHNGDVVSVRSPVSPSVPKIQLQKYQTNFGEIWYYGSTLIFKFHWWYVPAKISFNMKSIFNFIKYLKNGSSFLIRNITWTSNIFRSVKYLLNTRGIIHDCTVKLQCDSSWHSRFISEINEHRDQWPLQNSKERILKYEGHLQSLWTSYYSESKLCGGAVTVSFSKYLHWQAMHFLQRSTHFSKTCCRPLAASFRTIVEQAVLTMELPFHGWKSPQIAWSEIWIEFCVRLGKSGSV